jgi:raffinose/stachyose/melibiose transport system permease protein
MDAHAVGGAKPAANAYVRAEGPSAVAPRRKRSSRRRPSWLFLLPAAVVYLAVMLYPSFVGIYGAFTKWNGYTGARSFVGLKNFQHLVNDSGTVSALEHTLVLAVFITVMQTGLGLILALLVGPGLRLRSVFKALFFVPVILAPVAVSYLWQYLLGYNGAINSVLQAVGLDGLRHDWLAEPHLVLFSVGLVVVWQYCGATMVIFLAGLAAIPQQIFEAAAVDGAGRLRTTWSITLPLLRPALMLNVVLTTIGSIKIFDQVFVMTGGGPGYASETLSTVLYRQAFTYGDFGYGSAVALTLAVFALVGGFAQVSLLRERHGA